MAQSVSKTFTQKFSISVNPATALCDLTSESQSGSNYTRVYSLQANPGRAATVTLDINIPSNATVTKVVYTNTPATSGYYTGYTNTTMQLPDYGNAYANNTTIKNYLNASHPSAIRFYWYFGYVSQTITRTEASSSPELNTWSAWSANISSVTPKVVVTYTIPEEDDSVSFGTGNAWQKCKAYVAINGTWQKVKAYFGTGGSWKQVK